MKSISFWAKKHPIQARWLIFALCTLLNSIGITLGVLLFAEMGELTHIWTFWLVLILCIFTWTYPTLQAKRTRLKFYCQQKLHDFILYLTCFGLAVLLGNQLPNRVADYFDNKIDAIPMQSASISTPISKQNTLSSSPQKEKKTSKRKELKKQIREKIKTLKVNRFFKKLLVLLIIFATAYLLALVAALSCSLSCNGQEALAVLVGLGGGFLVVWGAVALIKSLR